MSSASDLRIPIEMAMQAKLLTSECAREASTRADENVPCGVYATLKVPVNVNTLIQCEGPSLGCLGRDE